MATTTETAAPKIRKLTREEHHRRLRERGLMPDPTTGRWGPPKAPKAPVTRRLPKLSELPVLTAPANPAATVTIAWGDRTVSILMPTDSRRDTAAQGVESLLHLIATQQAHEEFGQSADYVALLEADVNATLEVLDELKLLKK